MRLRGLALLLGFLTLASVQGCGYLPSQMSGSGKKSDSAHARINARMHNASCNAGARGFRNVRFRDIFISTGDPDQPFRESKQQPAQYDVSAYVWGYESCAQAGCSGGGHFFLIEPGPRGDFTTWVVTPQYPRIVIESSCRDRLKVGERYRFSFSRGALVGFSRR